jgi:hypothetical protein
MDAATVCSADATAALSGDVFAATVTASMDRAHAVGLDASTRAGPLQAVVVRQTTRAKVERT